MPSKITDYKHATTKLPPKHALLIFAAWCPHSIHILSVLKKCKLQTPLFKVHEADESKIKDLPHKFSGFPRVYIKKGTKYVLFTGNRTVSELTMFINS